MSHTLAQQLALAVETVNVLTTRAGCECICHILQVETDSSPERTVLSVDGIGAFDFVSRESMLLGLFSFEGGEAILRFPPHTILAQATFVQGKDGVEFFVVEQWPRWQPWRSSS